MNRVENSNIYHPVRDGSTGEFIVNASTDKAEATRAVSALNAVFSDCMQEIDERLQEIHANGLFVPDISDTPVIVSHYSKREKKRLEITTPIARLAIKQRQLRAEPGWFSGLQVLIPIGNYGTSWSIALVKGAAALGNVFKNDTHIQQICNRYKKQHPMLIETETFRKNPLGTLEEAIQTTAIASDFFSQNRLGIFRNDPVALLWQAHADKVYNSLSLLSPEGLLVPMANSGKVFRTPLETYWKNGENHVRLAEETRNACLAEKRIRGEFGPAVKRNKGCPVGRLSMSGYHGDGTPDTSKDTAIELLTQHYIKYVDYFYRRRSHPIFEVFHPTYTPEKARRPDSPWNLS